MVIDFVSYLEMKKAEAAIAQAERDAQTMRQEHLALVLTDLLAELQAA